MPFAKLTNRIYKKAIRLHTIRIRKRASIRSKEVVNKMWILRRAFNPLAP